MWRSDSRDSEMCGVWDTLSHEPILWCRIVRIQNMWILDKRWCAVDRFDRCVSCSRVHFYELSHIMTKTSIQKRATSPLTCRNWETSCYSLSAKIMILHAEIYKSKSYHFSHCHSCLRSLFTMVLSLSTFGSLTLDFFSMSMGAPFI